MNRCLPLIVLMLCPALGRTALAQAPARPADEKGLWAVWKTHTEQPTNHEAVAAACAALRQKSAQDPLAAVAAGLEAWHLLKAGKNDAARTVLEPLLAAPAGDAQAAGAEMARHWLTRMDREQVRAALQRHYRRHVEYPAALDDLRSLPAAQQPPLKDRWGTPWTYRLADFERVKGFMGQKYVLESPALGAGSDLARALEAAYGSRINLAPAKSLGGQMQFTRTSGDKAPVILGVGTKAGIVQFAYMGNAILVLSDGEHWQVAMIPR